MPKSTASEIRTYYILGLFLISFLIFGLGGWAAWASINGAVIAQATVVVESNIKKVQHAEGGIVSEIDVKDGAYVKAGQLLVRLDETETRANLSIVNAQLNELQARQARLEAERDQAQEVQFPQELSDQNSDPDIRKILIGQRNLFQARRETNKGKREQLKQRVSQLEDEIKGLRAQQKSKEKQVKLIGQELSALKILREKDLVPINRVLALEREAARLDGERGEHIAAIARARGQIGETNLRIIQIDQDTQTEVLTELRDAQTKIAELLERRIAAHEKLKRTEIRAPKSGIVHQLNVHTIGGVITASEPIMLIVPKRDKLILEAQVAPQSIDQIKVAQKAVVRFSAFDQRTTPELNGEVAHVSADLTRPTTDAPPYYVVRIKLPQQELKRFGKRKLKPGMPAEVFIQTGARTALSYLLKPLTDQIMRTFRER